MTKKEKKKEIRSNLLRGSHPRNNTYLQILHLLRKPTSEHLELNATYSPLWKLLRSTAKSPFAPTFP